ncbi:hypothetical protein JR338_02920 [Chloroflexota bacterium]|nr:hypothetical protein JR338_02920 [Chloroflexota bacterium]
MDQNLNSQSMEQQSDNHGNADKKRIDSIPLWLQGISENAAASQEPDEGEWQKEQAFVANQETGPTPIDISDIDLTEEIYAEAEIFSSEALEEKEIPLPNWIEESEEIADEEQTVNITLKQQEEPLEKFEEITEEVTVEQTPEPEMVEPVEMEISEPVSQDSGSNSEPAPWEGFETIQMDEVAVIEESDPEEIIEDSEEIPDWLRDMIAADEKHQEEAETPQPSWESDEPTQPVVVSSQEPAIVEETTSLPEVEPIIEASAVEEEVEEKEEPRPAFFNRPAVMPTARLGRLTGEMPQEESAPEPTEEPEEVVETETLNLDEIDIDLIRDSDGDFEGSGFQPIQFDPPVIDDQPSKEPSIEDAAVEIEPDISEEIAPEVIETEVNQPDQEVPGDQPEYVLEDWGTPSEPEMMEPKSFEGFEPVAQEPELEQHAEINENIPSSLIQAKQILEQGEVNEALDIIKSYISHSQYLNEIKDWLLKANNRFEKNKSGLWEALGDISSHQGDYSNALIAYAKAIDYLELSRKSHNELG